MQIGKYDLSKLIREFWDSPKRNMNLAMIFLALLVSVVYLFVVIFVIQLPLTVLIFGSNKGLFILGSLLLAVLPTLLFIPVAAWQSSILIHNARVMFREGSSKIATLGHMFDIDTLKANFSSGLKLVLISTFVYGLPVILVSIVNSLVSGSINYDNMQIFSMMRDGNFDWDMNRRMASTSPAGGLVSLCLSLFSLAYLVFTLVIINPTLVAVAIKHGFRATLNPEIMYGFIKKNISDLGYLAVVNLLVLVVGFIAAAASLLLLFLCVGFVLFPAVLVLLLTYQIYVTPALYAQAWGEKEGRNS